MGKVFFITLAIGLLSGYFAEAKIDAALYNERLQSLREISVNNLTCKDDAFAGVLPTDKLNISIVYGYNDQRPYLNVLDGNERKVLETGLQQACAFSSDRLCGFAQTAPGQFRKGQITINFISSSISHHDEWNRTTGQKQQYEASKAAELGFSQSIQNSDVVFYLGHARDGGGPDFYPPVLKENGQVNLKSYQAEKRGLKLLTQNLKASKKIKVLGLFACDAADHFTQDLLNTRADLSYVLAGAVTLPTNMDFSLWGALHSLLGKTCATTLKQNISSNPQGFPAAPFRLIKP